MKKLSITSYDTLREYLDTIPLDTEITIACLYQREFLILLNTFLKGKIWDSELENIADLLESKDGVSFENEYIKESIHEIANIDIQWMSMMDLVKWIVKEN